MNIKSIFKAIAVIAITLLLLAIVFAVLLFDAHSFRASVSGRITDAEGKPIVNAIVYFTVPNSDSTKYNCDTKTNLQGWYWIQLPQFRMALDSSPDYRRDIRISASGFETFNTNIELKKGNNPDCDYVLSPKNEFIFTIH